jgi:ABC-type Fe3+/spermidine/putrescine transport system ATPase subunit
MNHIAGKSLHFQGITKYFGDQQVLSEINLAIEAGEFVTLLGPSGSGKTTLLNIAAGYLDPSSGSVKIGEKDVTRMAARDRQIGMVFQNYALFPHMTVWQNIAYGPKVRRVNKQEIKKRVDDALAMVQLEDLAQRSIQALSGGQKQRVALARAMAALPDVIFMDEPLGALDRKLRKEVQLQIKRLHKEHARTTVYVTHDQEEALVMSDRIAVIRNGGVAQIGSPDQLYNQPNSAFIAQFLGESNLIEGKVTEMSDGQAVLESTTLRRSFHGTVSSDVSVGDHAALVIRPEHVALRASDDGLSAKVIERIFLGEIEAVRLRLADNSEFWSRTMAANRVTSDDGLVVDWDNARARIVPID